jgi:NAD-dependent SIR2 family protein deacetylase
MPTIRLLSTSFAQPSAESLRSDQEKLPTLSLLDSLPLPKQDDIDLLLDFFKKSSYLVAITGAGTSTNSGIPDYRGPEGSYKKGHKPMVHQEFVNQEPSRQRYWARSMVGWNRFSLAHPNDAHLSLARLESHGKLKAIITQNVDRLHQRAGARNVIDLHGRIDRVKCLQCGQSTSRRLVQQALLSLNPQFHSTIQYMQKNQHLMRADGDMELETKDYANLVVPKCQRCGGIWKPDVVFFGDNVPADRVAEITTHIDKCDAVLVVGTSLEVYSAYRFVDRANKRNVPLAILNFGETRAERQKLPMIRFKSEANCSVLLKGAVDRMLNE